MRSNGSCASTQKDCGPTWSPYHACCPLGTKCPGNQDNVICCESDADCSNYFKDSPRCADSTANLYHANGYFCCAAGLAAFELPNGRVGCTDDIGDLGRSTSLLGITSTGSGEYHSSTWRFSILTDDFPQHPCRQHPSRQQLRLCFHRLPQPQLRPPQLPQTPQAAIRVETVQIRAPSLVELLGVSPVLPSWQLYFGSF